jgi:hypothetical protein
MNSLAQNQQIINVIPVRIEAEHYQIASFTETDKIYNQRFDYGLKHWTCDCPNYTVQKNLNCKHLILLRAYIKQAKAPEQHYSSSQELISILTRIAKLENSASSLEAEDHMLNKDFEEHEYKFGVVSEKFEEQQKQIDELTQFVREQDKKIETLIAHDVQRKREIELLREEGFRYEHKIKEQAQQIDALHEQLSNQQKVNEQIVRIVVEDAKPKAATPAKEANEAIKPVKDANGKIVACKVGKFAVKVIGNCAASCNCSIGKLGRQCGHMIDVDDFLSK